MFGGFAAALEFVLGSGSFFNAIVVRIWRTGGSLRWLAAHDDAFSWYLHVDDTGITFFGDDGWSLFFCMDFEDEVGLGIEARRSERAGGICSRSFVGHHISAASLLGPEFP